MESLHSLTGNDPNQSRSDNEDFDEAPITSNGSNKLLLLQFY